MAVAVASLATACSPDPLPSSQPRTENATTLPGAQTIDAVDGVELDRGIAIDGAAPGVPIDPRLLGTNVPAWLGPERLAATWFLDAIEESGTTTIRMPGGSWSNEYDWVACELGFDDECPWTFAARPRDFATLLDETELTGVWTVSVNETAQHAAAAVAFFNGSPEDSTEIGVDRNGVDWGTVGDWATLRVERGIPDPVGIELWEIGNEVYGGRPDTGGEQCEPYGWEVVWTCDGSDYVVGDSDHDGYLDIRRAMLAVDPTISVGAVGVSNPNAWSDWGNEVIAAAGTELDFYVVHHYGYDESPDPSGLAAASSATWADVIESTRRSLPDGVPIAITEYNLVSVEASDTNRSMTRAVNAVFVADSIGQMAARGVDIANHWNLANGTTSSGTDYGLVDAEDGSRFPQFEGFAVWGRAGNELLEARIEGDLGQIRVYPTRHPDGSLSVIILQFDGESQTVPIWIEGVGEAAAVSITSMAADGPLSTAFETNGPVVAGRAGDVVEVEIPPWSISVVEVASGG